MKHKLTLSVEEKIIKLAKKKKINLSAFLQDQLCKKMNVQIVKQTRVMKNG